MRGVIPNDTAEIERLLHLKRQPLLYKCANFVIDVLPFFAQDRHEFLKCQPHKCCCGPWRSSNYISGFFVLRYAFLRHIDMRRWNGSRRRHNHFFVKPVGPLVAVRADAKTEVFGAEIAPSHLIKETVPRLRSKYATVNTVEFFTTKRRRKVLFHGGSKTYRLIVQNPLSVSAAGRIRLTRTPRPTRTRCKSRSRPSGSPRNSRTRRTSC